ncbi:hypothetical protein LguiA_027584 [Lonicera macranthoides]
MRGESLSGMLKYISGTASGLVSCWHSPHPQNGEILGSMIQMDVVIEPVIVSTLWWLYVHLCPPL